MNKELKNIIFNTVSNLRKLFAKLIGTNVNNNRKITELEKTVSNKSYRRPRQEGRKEPHSGAI